MMHLFDTTDLFWANWHLTKDLWQIGDQPQQTYLPPMQQIWPNLHLGRYLKIDAVDQMSPCQMNANLLQAAILCYIYSSSGLATTISVLGHHIIKSHEIIFKNKVSKTICHETQKFKKCFSTFFLQQRDTHTTKTYRLHY